MNFNIGNAAAGASIGALGGGAFANYGDPGKEAFGYLNQIPGTISPYFQPYINAGQQAMGSLMPQYQQLLSNPTFMMNQIGRGFQASPGYSYDVNQATQGANSAAAAGGYLGSPAEQSALSKDIMGMAGKDYWNYVNTGLGQYGMGLQGMGGINQLGYNASTGLGENLASALMSKANLAYASQVAKNQAEAQKSASTGGFWGGLAGLASAFLPMI